MPAHLCGHGELGRTTSASVRAAICSAMMFDARSSEQSSPVYVSYPYQNRFSFMRKPLSFKTVEIIVCDYMNALIIPFNIILRGKINDLSVLNQIRFYDKLRMMRPLLIP